jgi:hypothetical protein
MFQWTVSNHADEIADDYPAAAIRLGFLQAPFGLPADVPMIRDTSARISQ